MRVERLLEALGLPQLGVHGRAVIERIDLALHAIRVDVDQQVHPRAGRRAVAERVHVAELPRRVHVEQRKRRRARIERLAREVEHHRAVLAHRVEHDRPLALRDGFAHDVDALRLERLEVAQGPCRGHRRPTYNSTCDRSGRDLPIPRSQTWLRPSRAATLIACAARPCPCSLGLSCVVRALASRAPRRPERERPLRRRRAVSHADPAAAGPRRDRRLSGARACAAPRRSRRSASAVRRADELGEIEVTGSRSGRHGGRWRSTPTARARASCPATPFTEGERVTVRTDLDIAGARGRRLRDHDRAPGADAEHPQAGALQQGQGRGAGARHAPRADPAGGDGATRPRRAALPA